MIKLALILAALVAIITLGWSLDSAGQVISITGFGYQVEALPSIVMIAAIIFILGGYLLVSIILNLLSLPQLLRRAMRNRVEQNNLALMIEAVSLLLQNDRSDAIKVLNKLSIASQSKLCQLKTIISAMSERSLTLLNQAGIADKNLKNLINHSMIASLEEHSPKLANPSEITRYFNEFPAKSSACFVVRSLLKGQWLRELYEFSLTSRFKSTFKGESAKGEQISHSIAKVWVSKLIQQGSFQEAQKVLSGLNIDSEVIFMQIHALISAGEFKEAAKLLKKRWAKLATIELAAKAFVLSRHLKAEAFYDLAKSVYQGDAPSKLLLAKACLVYERFSEAGELISDLLAEQQSAYASLLMAEYCAKTHSSKLEIVEWIDRAHANVPEVVYLGHIQDLNTHNLEKLLDS